MKTVIVALGLRADAEEADALAAVSQLKDFERQVIALSGKSSLSEALGAMRAMAQSHEQVVALGAKVKELETDKRCQAFDALVKSGQDDVKLSPAVAKGEWIKSLRAREDGATQLTAFLADAPKVVGGDKPKEATGSNEVVAFSKEEIAIAKVVTGGDPVALKANLDKLSAYKRERAEILTNGLGR